MAVGKQDITDNAYCPISYNYPLTTTKYFSVDNQ